MSSKEPKPRSNHAAVGVGNMLYVWGGCNDSGPLEAATVERFDITSQTWQEPQQLPKDSLPHNLYATAVTSDGQNAYSFGGLVDSATVRCNNFYTYDFASMQCTEVVPPRGAPRNTACSGIVHFGRKLVIYGGYPDQKSLDRYSGPSAGLYVLDLTTGVCTQQDTLGDKPPPLSGHTFTKIDSHRAVVFGGFDGNRWLNDTYVLDITKWRWTKLHTGVRPCHSTNHAACCIAGPLTGQKHPLLMVVGGQLDNGEALNDVWLLDVDNVLWTKLKLYIPIKPRYGHSAVAFDLGRHLRMVVLFGGSMKEDYIWRPVSETTLLWLEPIKGSWDVTKVVKPDQLGRLNRRLREMMKRVQYSSQGVEKAHVDTDSGSQAQSTADDSSEHSTSQDV